MKTIKKRSLKFEGEEVYNIELLAYAKHLGGYCVMTDYTKGIFSNDFDTKIKAEKFFQHHVKMAKELLRLAK